MTSNSEMFLVSRELAERTINILPPPEKPTSESPMVSRVDFALNAWPSPEELLTGAPYDIERTCWCIGERVMAAIGVTMDACLTDDSGDLCVLDAEGHVHEQVIEKLCGDYLQLGEHAGAIEIIRSAVSEFCVWLLAHPEIQPYWGVVELQPTKMVVRHVPITPDLAPLEE